MNIIEHTKYEIRQLSSINFAKFREWFHKYERKYEIVKLKKDAKAGKFNALANKLLADHATARISQVRTTKLKGLIHHSSDTPTGTSPCFKY